MFLEQAARIFLFNWNLREGRLPKIEGASGSFRPVVACLLSLSLTPAIESFGKRPGSTMRGSEFLPRRHPCSRRA